ncbi:hypothetical protein F5X96DRAFT_347483 [Biscogniauxia mediterranea]|nr:hypothetical protein F5X96DRAFT_347483 [Biscogniauxia mediterranea]
MPPPRAKALMKPTKSKKATKEPKLDDADDYLALASEHEDAMGKHRAGDASKSLRFARRALDVYSQGLAKFPRNFDLAYNKARLELEVATHPNLSDALDVPTVDLLRQTLSSHQYAIDLESENADTLFNMAQVLTALAETIMQDHPVNSNEKEALDFLEKALDYQGRCFAIQQKAFIQSQLEFEQAMSEDVTLNNDASIHDTPTGLETSSAPKTQDEEEEQWVSVVEPVTADTLLDTIIAQVNTLTTLCSSVNYSLPMLSDQEATASLGWIESFSTKLLTGTLPDLTNKHRDALSKERLSEAALAKAVFTGEFLEVSFRAHALLDPQRYKRELDAAFSQAELDRNSDEFLLACARALISFNSVLAESSYYYAHHHGVVPGDDGGSDPSSSPVSSLRWSVLIEAQSHLTAASKLPAAAEDSRLLATTHLLRGDISLLLHALAYARPAAHPQARSTRAQLARNAEVYYRNAGKLFGTLGEEEDGGEEKAVAELKGGVVKILRQLHDVEGGGGASSDEGSSGPAPAPALRASPQQLQEALGGLARAKGERWVKDKLDECVEEGLVMEGFLPY